MSLWAEIGLHTTLYWGVHQFTQADPVSFQQAWSSGKHTWDTVGGEVLLSIMIMIIIFIYSQRVAYWLQFDCSSLVAE